MNKFEPQSRAPADQAALPEAVASELSRMPSEVIDLSEAPPLAPRAPLTQSEVRTILMSLMLTMFLAALDQTIVATALPTIGRQFQDVSNLSWVITAYLLASTAVAPVFGTLSDIYGRRAMIIAALSLFVVGSILCALAPNMPVLILARGLQGRVTLSHLCVLATLGAAAASALIEKLAHAGVTVVALPAALYSTLYCAAPVAVMSGEAVLDRGRLAPGVAWVDE